MVEPCSGSSRRAPCGRRVNSLGPSKREGSSSRIPVIAAMDNETLDHLLSVVDDARNLASLQSFSKPGERAHGETRIAIRAARPALAGVQRSMRNERAIQMTT